MRIRNCRIRLGQGGLCLLLLTSTPSAAAALDAPAGNAGASAAAASGSRQVSVQEAVALALENNLELQAIARDIDAARARQEGAALLLSSNPEATTAAGPRWMEGGGDGVDWGLEVSQRIEIGGQRGARVDAADAGMRGAQARLAASQAALAAQVREAFGRIVAARALARLAEDAVALATQALTAAGERHEAGDASLIEVNTARIEMGRATREASAAAQTRDRELASLKLLLGLPAQAAMMPIGDLASTGLCDDPVAELLAAARSQRGDLAAAHAKLEQAQAEQTLAQREAIATPSFGVAYNREDDAHILQATLSVPLPIFDRNQEARGVAGAGLAQAKLAVESLERAVSQDVVLAVARCKAARSVMETYKGEIAGAADSNLDLAAEGYRAGKLDFLQLLLIRREALEARRGAIESQQEWNAADAQMVRATGTVR